jgi:hypothetical protein
MNVRPTGPRPTHPDARNAIWLAHLLDGAPPGLITKVLNETNNKCPRPLFILATELMKGNK